MSKYIKQPARGVWTRDLGNKKKKTVMAATGPAGALYKQWTAKDMANVDRTNNTMVEYGGFTFGPIACWERRNMDPGLNPSGRLTGPVIRTCTRHFWRGP